MSQRSAFQVQILEKLGAPLVNAVGEVAARQKKDGEDTQKQEAERVAELLGKAVQISVALAATMDLKDAGQADSVRLALAALAGSLVAGQYRLTGKVPVDMDIKRLTKALEAVLTFSDNFAPAAENTVRLENIQPGTFLIDENQINIRYVHALVPVVSAIAAFPFGRPEAKLVQEVADRLVKRAESMGKFLFGNAPPITVKQAELGILSALAALFVECHQEEKNRLMAMDEKSRAAAGGTLSLDPVWAAFEIRAGMAELLGKSAVSSGGGDTKAPAPEIKAAPIPASPPVPPPAPQPPPAAPPAEQGEGDSGGAYNPMGFFKPVQKKAAGEGGGS